MVNRKIDLKVFDNIIGRNNEIDEMSSYIDFVQTDSNLMISISAPSGVGKSTLVEHILNTKKNDISYTLNMKIDKYKHSTPYELLYNAIRNLTKQLLIKEKDNLNPWKHRIKESLGQDIVLLTNEIPELNYLVNDQEISNKGYFVEKAKFDSILFKFLKLFTEYDKPLCIFIDDIQWADFITLKWIENAILTLNNTVIITAYRDNELEANQELGKLLSRLKSYDTNLKEIKLEELNKENIYQLIKQSIDLKDTQTIADIVYHKTNGNAFFTKMYLRQLQKDKIIYFNEREKVFNCDLERVYKLPLNFGLFEFLNKNIDALSYKEQRLLKLASCIGSIFSKDFLKKVYNDEATFESSLEKLTKEEWFLKEVFYSDFEQITYHFSHDKIQQFVYSTLSDEELQNYHKEVGFSYFNKDGSLDSRYLITAMNHMNKIFRTLEDEDTLRLIKTLNIKACRSAKRSGDFENALIYIKNVEEIISRLKIENSDYAILRLRGECEHLCHNKSEAIKYYNIALKNASTKIQKAKVYELIIKLYTDISDFKTAYETGIEAAKLFDITLPKSFNKLYFIFDFLVLKLRLKSKNDVAFLYELENAKDEDIITAVRILSAILKVAYQIRPELSVAISVKIVNICLKYGLTKESVIGFMVFGVNFQGGILGNHTLGYDYSRFCRDMLNRFEDDTLKSEVDFVCGYFSNSWINPSSDTEKQWLEAYKIGLETGDWFHIGCSAAGITQSMFMRGVPFDKVYEKIKQFEVILKSINAKEQLETIVSIKQAMKCIQKQTVSNSSFTDSKFDEFSYMVKIRSFESKHFAHYYFINKMIALYFNEEYSEANEVIYESKEYKESSLGMLHNTEHTFYEAMIKAMSYKEATFFEKYKIMKQLDEAKSLFHKWSRNCPENFYVRALLLEAEAYRLKKDYNQAKSIYKEALIHASNYKQLHLKAITNRLLSYVYKEKKDKLESIFRDDYKKCMNIWKSEN